MDPGFGRLGYGIVERRSGVLRTAGYGLVQTPKDLPIPARLKLIHDSVSELLKEYEPDCVATERVLFAANKTTALDVSKALGVVLLAAAEASLPWCEYAPPQVKLTVTGSGSADKGQVQFMAAKLLALGEAPKPDDVADALAIAICHCLHSRARVS